ncbi:MAG: nucleotidyltransferase domain-containing protein [Bacteroidetes bacterium]|nr:nucleotidyltransferase domain-containing protein [Bacteroidota bacterium]
MKYGLKPKHIDAIVKIFSGNPNISEAVLFGSRAKGNHKAGSDIDIALKGKINLKDVLFLHRLIDELNLPYKFDLIIFSQIKEPALIDHINRVGQTLYGKNFREYA